MAEPAFASCRETARRILTAAIAESIPFRLGVLGATEEEKRAWAGKIVDLLDRPALRPALAALAK